MLSEIPYFLRGRHCQDRQPDASSYYQNIYKSIFETFDMLNYIPDLIIIYSRQRDSMIYKGKGKTQYTLIHDQYLGQTLNHLSTALFSRSNLEALKNYACKYTSESFRSSGLYPESLLFGLEYGAEKREIFKKIEHARVDPKRNVSTLCAEIFVLTHEIAHILYKDQSSSLKRKHQSNIKFIQENSAFNDNNLIKDRDANVPILYDKSSLRDWKLSEEDVNNLAEELTCDDIASSVTFEVMAKYCDNPWLVTETLHITHLFLRWLKSLSGPIRCYIRGERVPLTLYKERIFSQIRCNKNNLNCYYILYNRNWKLTFEDEFDLSQPRAFKQFDTYVDDGFLLELHNKYTDLYWDVFRHSVEYIQKRLYQMQLNAPFLSAENLMYLDVIAHGIPLERLEKWGIEKLIDYETGWLIDDK